MAARTLFDKLWDAHVIDTLGDGAALLHVDRHIFIDLHSHGMVRMADRGLSVRNPELTTAVADHVVSSEPGRTGGKAKWSEGHLTRLREGAKRFRIQLHDVNDPGQGIAHVVGPELGLTQPGVLLLCGDSHTSTHGALGALSWGIGASEVMHVLATQTIVQRKPKRMRLTFKGKAAPGVEAKDLILAAIGQLGTAGGTGYAVEYTGEAITDLDIEGRMTLCNLSIEMGAKTGMVAPDEKTIEWLRGRPHAPSAAHWDAACAYWRTLKTDPDAVFDREETVDVTRIVPQITWGTSPMDVIGVDGVVPDPASATDADRRAAMQAALDYTGLVAGQKIAGTRIDRVFIGSCTNSRLTDLRRAADVVRASGGRVASHVQAWVVPGSKAVKRAAEAEGLDKVFLAAGFEWREPGCSMCVGANGEFAGPKERVVSTSNRNFPGRQGPQARTHLASPSMAAASALAGVVADPRQFLPKTA